MQADNYFMCSHNKTFVTFRFPSSRVSAASLFALSALALHLSIVCTGNHYSTGHATYHAGETEDAESGLEQAVGCSPALHEKPRLLILQLLSQ